MFANKIVYGDTKCYCSFRGDRNEWNFLGQTAASRCEGFPTFREL